MMTPDRMLHLVRGLCVTALGFAVLALAPGQSRAATLTPLVSFCAQTNCADGANPFAGLLADASGNLFGTTESGGANDGGTVFEIAKTASGFAGAPTILYSFCAQTNCADGSEPVAGLIADAGGNLFGTTSVGGANNGGTVFEIAKTASGFAGTPTILYSFCAQHNCADGLEPFAGLTADAGGNLFGTTEFGGANDRGTVFEIAKTASGFAGTPTILYSFCAQANCTDGSDPVAGLLADASGNLFGTTFVGGANDRGTVFEVTLFAGTPGTANCVGASVAALARKYRGLNAAAAALGDPSAAALQLAIASFCRG
jgi:uncharacterized repeat protein (TIGR03803 family)